MKINTINRRSQTPLRLFLAGKHWSWSKCFTVGAIILFAVAFLFTILVASNPYPAHASCLISWKVTNSCSLVKDAIENQIEEWRGPENCKQGGQRCLYELIEETNSSIKATHTTPVQHYVDDMTFQFDELDEISTCTISGFSESQIWYAVLDYGTNYCNLHNLITGAGLDQASGYSESTQDSQCTQYSKAHCDKY